MKFLDQTQFAAGTVSESTNPVCASTFSLIPETTDKYKAVFTQTTPDTCDWGYTAGVSEFRIYINTTGLS
jgi:hypothetical protein